MTYGPNTNIVVNGSIVFFSEAEVGYILQLLHEILSPDGKCYKGAFDCKKEVFDKYQVFVDEGNAKRAWGRPGSEVNSWYKNECGLLARG